MKISRLTIGSFGKLKNFSIDFGSGLNIVYGNNEDGKSTIMAFIRAMFYGKNAKSSDLSKNFRKKYLPWDGTKMSGSVEFEADGLTYRLEKEFGPTNAADKITLWNLADGEKEKIPSGTDIGQRFFGIGASAFEKSVFIGQLGNVVNGDSDKDDEITQKLTNLVSTGDESISQKKVTGRLLSAKEFFKSKGGKVGLLDKQIQYLNLLKDELASAKADEAEKNDAQLKINRLYEQKASFEKEYQHHSLCLELQQKLADIDRLDALIVKKKGIDELFSELNQKKALLTAGELTVDTAFLDSCEQKISGVNSLKEKSAEKKQQIDSLNKQLDDLKSEDLLKVTSLDVSDIKAKINEQDTLLKNISGLERDVKKLSEINQQKKDLSDSEKHLSLLEIQKKDLEGKIDALKTEILGSRQKSENDKLSLDLKNSEVHTLKEQSEIANTDFRVAAQHYKDVLEFSDHRLEMAQVKLKQATAERQTINDSSKSGINLPFLFFGAVLLIISVILGITIHFAFYAGIIGALILCFFSYSSGKIKTASSKSAYDKIVLNAKEKLDLIQAQIDSENRDAYEKQKLCEEKLAKSKVRLSDILKNAEELKAVYLNSIKKLSDLENKGIELNTDLQVINEKVSSAQLSISEKRQKLDEIIALFPNLEDIPSLKIMLDENIHSLEDTENYIRSRLYDLNCADFDKLIEKNMKWQNYQSRLSSKSDDINNAVKELDEFNSELDSMLLKALTQISAYRPVENIDDAVMTIKGLRDIISETEILNIKINSQSELLHSDFKNKSASELNDSITLMKDEILSLNNGSLPKKLNDDEITGLKELCGGSLDALQKTKEDIIRINSDIRNKFLNKKTVSEIDNEISSIGNDISEKEEYCGCIDTALAVLDESFIEIRQSFGPMLNTATAQIFEKLTGGKYRDVIVSRSFDINIRDGQGSSSHEWQYLSSGTIDQAYFSLRLAVSDLLAKSSSPLPILLDDVFMQYDDYRTELGMNFLNDYSKNTQIIMFTCHNNILESADKVPGALTIRL